MISWPLSVAAGKCGADHRGRLTDSDGISNSSHRQRHHKDYASSRSTGSESHWSYIGGARAEDSDHDGDPRGSGSQSGGGGKLRDRTQHVRAPHEPDSSGAPPNPGPGWSGLAEHKETTVISGANITNFWNFVACA